jgi:hypothetical protein
MKAIRENPEAVSDAAVYKIAETLLKNVKRTDAMPEDERQGYFDFYNLAEFRRVGRMIHYFNPETNQWQYIPYAESLEKHRKFRIEKLREKLADDEATLKAEIEADGVLAKEVVNQGDLPAWQLIAGRPVPPKTRGRRRAG